jgi:hypothetical protein
MRRSKKYRIRPMFTSPLAGTPDSVKIDQILEKVEKGWVPCEPPLHYDARRPLPPLTPKTSRNTSIEPGSYTVPETPWELNHEHRWKTIKGRAFNGRNLQSCTHKKCPAYRVVDDEGNVL